MLSDDWVMLTYNDGAKYNSHCGSENRRAKIMFVCDPAATVSKICVVFAWGQVGEGIQGVEFGLI